MADRFGKIPSENLDPPPQRLRGDECYSPGFFGSQSLVSEVFS